MEISDLKAAIDKVGRRRVAEIAGFSYFSLTQRLNKFQPIKEEEEVRLLDAIARCNGNDNTVGDFDNKE